jgi:hypothetical protein
MRRIGLWCAIALAAGVPVVLKAEDGGLTDAQRIMVAAGKKAVAKKPVAKKKVAKPAGSPARQLFGAAKTPAPLAARAIGFYAKGCLAGAAALPVDGAAPSSSAWLRSSPSRHASTTAGRACWSATCRNRAAGRC